MKPEGDEAKELEEILAKRQKRGKVEDDKPMEEKSIFHSKYKIEKYLFYFGPHGIN
jgi:pre-mRNA-processing factor 17